MSIELAYLELLKIPHGDLFRALNQDIYARLRDAVAAKLGIDSETAQNRFEEIAQPSLFEAMGLSQATGDS
jgi:hypothetical protein